MSGSGELQTRMKSICALVHMAGSNREVFQHYYEASHAPLAVRYFPFSRYVRNHVIGGADVGFDTISEFWTEQGEAAAALLDGPVGEVMRLDEEKFMDRARKAPAGVSEHVLSAGPAATADGLRTALLIYRKCDASAALPWAWQLAAVNPGVSLDMLTAGGDLPFPATAVLWLPGDPPTLDPPASLSVRRLLLRRCETPLGQLLQA